MRLLALHNGENASAVDIWRILRPASVIKANTDWHITEQPAIIPAIDKYKSSDKFTEEEFAKAYEKLKGYNIIWASYSSFLNPFIFALCYMLHDKENVKLVVDVDDNVFSINPDNIGWWLRMSHEATHDVQTVVAKAPYITTSTEKLANELRKRRSLPPDTVKVLPNYISRDYPVCKPDNKDIVKIGYFGGASHFYDTHKTGFDEALVKIMHEYKNVRAYSVGIPFEFYLPKSRYEYIEGKKGHGWYRELFGTLQFDISCAPLMQNAFNNGKSNIKWQESSMMGAAFVGSDLPPYAATVKNGEDGLLVRNTEEAWYEALKKLVEDETYRRKLADTAQARVLKEFMIDDHWQAIKEVLEGIDGE